MIWNDNSVDNTKRDDVNMKVLEIKKILKRDVIVLNHMMRPLEDMKNDDIKNLSESIDSTGLINEIDIRIKDGKYELMAGGRRFVATKDEYIMAKIYQNVSDFDAIMIGLDENEKRKNPDTNIIDEQIYKAWKEGKRSGKFKSVAEFARRLNRDIASVSGIITAGELKDADKSPIIQKATSRDLEKTKVLSEEPELRKELLKKEQEGHLISEDMMEISKEIKSEIDKGTKKDIVKKALEISTKSHIVDYKRSSLNKDNIKDNNKKTNGNKDIKNIIVSKVSGKHFGDVLNTLKVAPPDVTEKLEKGEIDIKEAKDISQFASKEAREQVLKEIKTIEERKEAMNQIYEEDKKNNIVTRLQQQEEIEKKGDTGIKTRFDKEYEEKHEKESNKDEIFDETYLDRYQRLSSYTLSTIGNFHPERLKTDNGKRRVLSIIRALYELYQKVLIECGEIKEINPEDKGDNIKHLTEGDIKIVKKV